MAACGSSATSTTISAYCAISSSNPGQVGVFVEYTPLAEAKFPTQFDENYAALEWVTAHAADFGADGSRIAVAGNSVGGDMTAALTLMAKDRNGPKISYQVLLIPATDASVDSASYLTFGQDRFLGRAFMKYGWDPLRSGCWAARQSLRVPAPRHP